jgi:hypothetical protein
MDTWFDAVLPNGRHFVRYTASRSPRVARHRIQFATNGSTTRSPAPHGVPPARR